jgi:thiol-disulfide isomerase/thioredoxin
MLKYLSLFIVLSSISFLFAQDVNKVVPDTSTGKPMLIGDCTRDAFKDTSFSWWFDSGYNMYQPDSMIIDGIKQNMNNVNVTIVMGSWCSDSREQVPHFFKVMDKAGFPEGNIKIICVDRAKKDLSGEVDSLNIELVPTFIFYRDGEAIGRIIETPQETIEEDTQGILDNSASKDN